DRIAIAARAGIALARETHLRAGFDPLGQFEIDRRAVTQLDALRLERCGLLERHTQAIGDVRTLGGRWAPPEPARKAALLPRARAATEQPFQYVLEAGLAPAKVELCAAGPETALRPSASAAKAST